MAYSSTFFDTPVVATLLSTLHELCFSKAWSEKSFSELLLLEGTTAQIISHENEPCAFALYQVVGADAEILTLGVIPISRGKSIGHIILSQGATFLKDLEVTRLFLEVSATNTAALKLYQNSGFLKIGYRKNYYSDAGSQSDAVIMEITLI